MPLAGESGLNVKTKIALFCKIDLQEIIKFLIIYLPNYNIKTKKSSLNFIKYSFISVY